jgi:hypothetical protein
MGVPQVVCNSVAMVSLASPFAEPRARPSPIRRASATAAALALLMLAFSTPAQATSTWPVVLTVADQGGSAFLQWQFGPTGVGVPSPELWIVTKWTDGGQPIEIVLPGSASSYVDSDVEAGPVYAYTVSYVDDGVRSPPSNPVVFLGGCPIRCPPVDFNKPFPWIDLDCICLL